MKKGEKYENDYLNEVVFRINFSTVLSLSGNNEESAEDFRKHVFNVFPQVSVKQNHEVNIGLNLESELQEINQNDKLVWFFLNKENTKIVELSDSYLILTYKKGVYSHFRDFLDDVNLIIDALNVYAPINPKFIELRYINQLYGKSVTDLNEYINNVYYNPDIIQLNGNNTFVQNLSRLTLNTGKYLLNFQYGLFNPAYPEPNFDKDFVLDYDCIYYNIESLNSIQEELKKMNKCIWDHFQRSITDKLSKEMKGDIS